MEGLLDAISGDFSNVKKMVGEMSLGGFIAAMSSEQTQGMLELVLKLRSSPYCGTSCIKSKTTVNNFYNSFYIMSVKYNGVLQKYLKKIL